MARIVHGYHISKGRRHMAKVVAFLFFVIAAVIIIGGISGASRYDLALALGLSLFRLVAAYLLSLIIAVLVAVSIGDSKWGDLLIPVFDLMQNLPSFALIPLFVVWFGYTNFMAIFFAATSILWPILFYMLHALKTSRKDMDDAAKIFGARGWRRIVYYSLPVAFPAAVTGSIVGFSLGWEAIIGIEIIGLSSGIGVFLNNVGSNNNMLTLGISALLLITFLINRLIWMPLLKETELYAEQ